MTSEREAKIREKGTELANLQSQLRDNQLTGRGGKTNEEIAQLASERDVLEGKINDLEREVRNLKYLMPHERT